MDHREGADKTGDVRLDFDRRVRLEFHGSKISSNGGLLLFRELDEVLGLHDIAGGLLRDTRTGHNRLHSLVGLLRQSVFGRLAGYDDVNDADRLSLDPVMRQVVRVSVPLCMTDLAHASKLKEHDDNDDFQGTTGRAA